MMRRRRRRRIMKLRHSCNIHICSSRSAVSVHTLQPLTNLHIFHSLSCSFLLVAGGDSLTHQDLSSQCGESRRSCAVSERLCFYAVERLRTFGVPNLILLYTRTQVFETNGTETVTEKQGRMGSLRFWEHTACTTAHQWSPSILPRPSQFPLDLTFWYRSFTFKF
jgi:hypothetical protein